MGVTWRVADWRMIISNADKMLRVLGHAVLFNFKGQSRSIDADRINKRMLYVQITYAYVSKQSACTSYTW